MKINNEDIEHIKAIMLERGINHCGYCQELFKRLEDAVHLSSEKQVKQVPCGNCSTESQTSPDNRNTNHLKEETHTGLPQGEVGIPSHKSSAKTRGTTDQVHLKEEEIEFDETLWDKNKSFCTHWIVIPFEVGDKKYVECQKCNAIAEYTDYDEDTCEKHYNEMYDINRHKSEEVEHEK